MLFYNLLFLLIPLIYVLIKQLKISSYIKINSEELFLLIIFVLLFIISGIRGMDVGTDTKTYMTMFYEIGTNNIHSFTSIEPFFYLINLIFYFICSNPHTIIIVMSLITIASFIFYVYKFSTNYLLSIILFLGLGYFFLSFNISRQFLGLSIMLIALYNYQNNNTKLFILFMILAILTHYSMLVWLPFIIFSKINFNKKRLLLLIIILPICIPLFLFLLDKIIIYTHYSVYLNEHTSRSLSYYLFLVFKIFCLCLFFYKSDNGFINKKNKVIIYTLLMNIVIDILTLNFAYFARLTYCIEPYLIISIPCLLIEKIEKKYLLVFYIFFFIVGLVFINTVIDNNSFFGIVPYYTFFNTLI